MASGTLEEITSILECQGPTLQISFSPSHPHLGKDSRSALFHAENPERCFYSLKRSAGKRHTRNKRQVSFKFTQVLNP